MLEYISGNIGLLWDVALFGGIILFLMSFFNRFQQHKKKLILSGAALIILGIAYTDHMTTYDAFLRGIEPYDAFMDGYEVENNAG